MNLDYIISIIWLLLALLSLGIANIAARTYYNVDKTENEEFDKKKFFKGVKKVILILYIVAALTFVWLILNGMNIDSQELLNPLLICKLACVYHFGLVTNDLLDIWNIKDFVSKQLGKVE
jgi:cell division protein FtsW (lipid II flippase)